MNALLCGCEGDKCFIHHADVVLAVSLNDLLP